MMNNPVDKRKLVSLAMAALAALAAAPPCAFAQRVETRAAPSGYVFELRSADGRSIPLQAEADDDGDGIANRLEINGYAYSPETGLRAWEGEGRRYVTDPLRWSTDGDPYSDYMEVTGVNMPAGVPAPENHPLVAARPVINIDMTGFDVIPISQITNTEGGEQSTEFTNETSSTHEVGGEVTVEAELNPFKLVGGSVTASYSHTWSRTQSTTSSFGSNWSTARSTDPSRAARLKLRVYMRNLGSATALDVRPTFNLTLGDKTLATITPNQAAGRLAPAGLPSSRYPESGDIVIERDEQNNDIIVSLEELKAIQSGAPLGLTVTQVGADVARWNPETRSFDSREEWAGFEGEIDPVVVTFKANMGGGDIRQRQVYVGTDFYDPGFTFRDALSFAFGVEEGDGALFVEGRRYPDDWYVSTNSQPFINEWNRRGQPQSLMDMPVYRNSSVSMMSPGPDPEADIHMATYAPDFRRIYLSAFPDNFPIVSVRAEVTVGGERRAIELVPDGSFFTNPEPLDDPAEPGGRVYVENARGDIATAEIGLPALYRNAAEIKQHASFLPNPGGEYMIFPRRAADRPVKLYCLFFDPESGEPLEEPLEYLTLPAAGPETNFIDWLEDTVHKRIHFTKVRIDPETFAIDSPDLRFTRTELVGDDNYEVNEGIPKYFGAIRLSYAHLETARANVDLTGTPFSLDPFTEFQGAERGALSTILVDESRKTVNVEAVHPPDHDSDSEGDVGIKPGPIPLVYGRDLYEPGGFNMPGRSVSFNISPEGEGGYLDMGAPAGLELRDAFTIEMWIKPEPHARLENSLGVLLNKEGEYELFWFPDGTIRWALAIGSPHWRTVNTHYSAPAGEWTHVALAYDANEPVPAVRTYINGTLFHATPASGPVGDFSRHQNQDRFRLAGREAFPGDQYAGALDEVRVWNRARPEAEIRATMTAPLGPEVYESPDSGLIGYWRFDELEDLGAGGDGADDVRDYSPFGHHGDLAGDAGLTGLSAAVEAFSLHR